MGLLAQDVKIAFPQLAKKINRNYLGVNYPAFTAILVEAIKELTEKNSITEKKLRMLEKRVEKYTSL